jgi:hypothetical protein
MKEIINNKNNNNNNNNYKKNNFTIVTNVNKIYTNTYTIESYNSTESNNNQQENQEIENETLSNIKNIDETIEKIYEIMYAYKLSKNFNILLLKNFVISPVPLNKCLISNVIINKHCFLNKKKILYSNNEIKENSKIIDFDFYMELNNNNRLFLLGLICDNITKLKIKFFITFDKISFKYLGKIESNFLRKDFNVFFGDHKNNYIKIMNIKYSLNFFEFFHLRKMNIEIFKKIENGNEIIIKLKNKMPLWSNKYNLYQLAFNNNNRVKFKNKKNFIIINENNTNLIECGKKDKNNYSLDFVNPISPFMAFSICVSSLVTKITC